MPIRLQQRPMISVGDIEKGAVSFADFLDSAETLTGTPVVAEVGSTDLTLSSPLVNTLSIVVLGVTVAAGQAVEFGVRGQKAGTLYTISVTASTSAGRTAVRYAEMECV
jgi:hypothetical protein